MAETEQLVYINGHAWIRVPSNSTQPTELYPESQVRAAGGDPAVVRGPVVSSNSMKA
jgi:hypothetical protein